jgi:hypothetical protein
MVNGSSTTSHPNVVEHYIVPDAGHQVMIVNPELVNPVITEFLIKKCGLETLSGAWQILNKTAGENKWDLKNYEKVRQVVSIHKLFSYRVSLDMLLVETHRHYFIYQRGAIVVQGHESNATDRH